MDFNQCKLTKNEWNSIEIPITTNEKYVCDLIIRGFNNVNITLNRNISLISFLKIKPTNSLDNYVYYKYLQNDMTIIVNNYKIDYFNTIPKDNLKIKKADEIRFNNTDKQLSQNKNDIIEFVAIHIIDKLYKNYTKGRTKWVYYYYTLANFLTFNFVNFNSNLKNNINTIIERLSDEVDYTDMISRGVELIENNAYLFKYSDDKLYDHQKELFTFCKDKRPKLIQYIAPTGT